MRHESDTHGIYKLTCFLVAFAVNFLSACGDSKGGGSSLKSSSDDVLWSEEQLESERASCIEGNTENFGDKAGTWCYCIVEASSKRWTHDEFFRAPIEKFEALAADGTGAMCNAMARLNEWNVEDLTAARSNCIETAIDYNSSLESKRANVSLFCGCVLEDASRRWTFSDYVRNEYAYTQQQQEDGTMRRCNQFAGF